MHDNLKIKYFRANAKKANAIMKKIRRLRKTEAKEGLNAFMLPIEEIT